MTTPNKLNEFNHAEDPARRLLERLGWTYVPAEQLEAERPYERDVSAQGPAAGRAGAPQRRPDRSAGRPGHRRSRERAGGIGMARNQRVHEYLTYGMSLTVETPDGRDTRTVRFFDFDDPVGGNEFVVTTQFRVRRGNDKGDPNDDRKMVIPDLVLFVNGIPLVVMEAKSPTLMDVWKTQAVQQLRRYQEAEPKWTGSRRAGAVPLQPPVRRPLRGRRRVLHPLRAGERVLRVEVGTAVHGTAGARRVRRRTAGPGSVDRRPAGAGHAAGHPAGLRGL